MKFTARPIEVEAWLLEHDNAVWLADKIKGRLTIPLLGEGQMTLEWNGTKAHRGMYVVEEAPDEFFPWDREAFEAIFTRSHPSVAERFTEEVRHQAEALQPSPNGEPTLTEQLEQVQHELVQGEQ